MTYDTNISIKRQLALPEVPPARRLLAAIGILKGKGGMARKEIKAIRREWATREKKQFSLAKRRA